ncbi:MAG: metal-dependent hydrolase [Acidobacteria bacterium]|nr:metal-dependent hydrolase [Acidobacteriota bacterium]
MDPITQGILGAAASQSIMKRRLPAGAGWIGAISGVAADLDVLIHSASDPTVGWLYHRHFTHSLAFIPVGGFLAALPFLFLTRFKNHRRDVILSSIIGYATHGLLDAFTNYGTQLFWPFSNHRVAWDWIGIVDPIYTLILLVGVWLTARTLRTRPARLALLFSCLYLCFGGWQHGRAVEAQKQIARLRGHQIAHSRVMPAPGWLLYWRSVYISNGRLYADGIKIPWFSLPLAVEGGSADATTFEDLPEVARANPETQRRFDLFYWFADGLITPINDGTNAIGDQRITAGIESLNPIWGLQFDPANGDALRWIPSRIISHAYNDLIKALFFGDPRYKPL